MFQQQAAKQHSNNRSSLQRGQLLQLGLLQQQNFAWQQSRTPA
jgi:hypothetical protein